MSDRPNLPPSDGTDDRDLLVAAYVDGEATPDERARVEADPDLLARADRFRAAKAIVADVPPLSSAKRESFLAAALAEHASSGAPATSPGEAAPRQPGVPSIARPPAPARKPVRWLAVAAAALVFFAGGVIVAAQLGGGDDDQSGVADEAGDAAATLAPSEVAGGGDTTGGTSTDRSEEVDGDQSPGAPAAQDDTQGSAAPGSTVPARTAFEPADESTSSLSEATTSGGNELRMQPPDDGQLAVIDRSDLVDWYERVKAGTLTPPGAGSSVCDMKILGWLQLTDPKRNVVVVQTSSDRLVAFGAPPRCDRVIIAQVP